MSNTTWIHNIQSYIYTYIHTYIHTYIRTYVHTYIYIIMYIHTYINTYILNNTYIHTVEFVYMGSAYILIVMKFKVQRWVIFDSLVHILKVFTHARPVNSIQPLPNDSRYISLFYMPHGFLITVTILLCMWSLKFLKPWPHLYIICNYISKKHCI